MTQMRTRAILLVATLVWLLMAWDGRLHWDEPGFLYQGAYQSLEELLAAEFQPSGLEGFSLARVAHVLLVHGVCGITGPGKVAFGIIAGLYLALLLGVLGLTFDMLRRLMPGLRELPIAVGVTAFAPVTLYLAFKTLPETPAVFFTVLACYALVRSREGLAWAWAAVIAVSLALVGLTKQTPAVAFAGFVPVLLAWEWRRGAEIRDRRVGAARILAATIVGGLLSLVLWAAALQTLGLSVRAILIQAASVAAEREPVASMLLQTGLTSGLLYLALPLAFLSPRRLEAALLLAWFVLCTLPLIVLTESIEVRYLAQNLPPLCGLAALSLEGLRRLLASRPRIAAAGASVAAVAIILTGSAAQLVLPHEIEMDEMASLLEAIDETFPDGYAVLTPWDYTDYHYLRFMEPGRDIYNVHSRLTQKGKPDPHWTVEEQRRWYGERLVASPEQLATVREPRVYVGFEQAFPVANLRWIASFIPSQGLRERLDRELSRMSPRRHIRESWLWNHPDYTFVPIAETPHYRALRVQPVEGTADAVDG